MAKAWLDPPPARVVTRPWWLLPAAGLWAFGLVVVSYLVRPSLEQVNGPLVLLPLGAPLVVVVLVTLSLAMARPPARWPTVVAWVLAALLDGLALVGMLTVGIFILPVAGMVTVACALS
jgi:hypothetical protein